LTFMTDWQGRGQVMRRRSAGARIGRVIPRDVWPQRAQCS
jgi:hypothetical protein